MAEELDRWPRISDDELSELEEFMDQACRAWVRAGGTLGVFGRGEGSCGCLVEVVAWYRTGDQRNWSDWRPLGIPWVSGFGSLYAGFDGTTPATMDPVFYAMGARFRERVQAGEYR